MCAPITSMPGFKQVSTLGGLLGDKNNPHMMASRYLDKKFFGWNDQTKFMGGGGETSPQGPGQVDLFRNFVARREIGLGGQPKR